MPETIWQAFASEHSTVSTLARRFGLSKKTIRRRLDSYALPVITPSPRSMVAIGDATKIGPGWLLVIRDPNASENVYGREILWESTSDYQQARAELEQAGFVFTAFVGDGRVATPWVFDDIPVQMCHFHQEQIIVGYTTRKPELPVGQELLSLAKTLAHTDKATFTKKFEEWCARWKGFLNEKSIDLKTGDYHFTHRRLRSARNSLRQHLPYLFTFENYPELNIPNTTNSLDGAFKKVKTAIAVHSGLTYERKLKLVTSLIMKTK